MKKLSIALLLTATLLCACGTESKEDQKVTTSEKESETTVSDKESESEEEQAPVSIEDNVEVNAYKIDTSSGIAIIKNNNDKPIFYSITAAFLDASGNTVYEKTYDDYACDSNAETAELLQSDNSEYDSIQITYEIKEMSERETANHSNSITITDEVAGDSVKATLNNNFGSDLSYVYALCVYYNGSTPVDCGFGFTQLSDTAEITFSKTFDTTDVSNYKIYICESY